MSDKPARLSRSMILAGLSLVALLAVALVFLGWLPRQQAERERQESHSVLAEPYPHVAVLHPQAGPTDRTLTLPGSLEAFQEASLNARVDGYVSQWFVDIGDHVRAGQRLAVIDAPELEQRRAEAVAAVSEAQAQVAEAESEVRRTSSEMARLLAEEEQARAEVGQSEANILASRSDAEFARVSNDRWQQLVSEQAISLQEADQRASTYQAARANVQANQEKLLAARSRVKAARARQVALRAEIETGRARVQSARSVVVARQAAVNRIDAQRRFCQVEAPFDGQITQRLIDVGSLVSAGGDKTALYHLARSNRLRVFIDVPEPEVPLVRLGQKATLALREFPGRQFVGAVSRTAGSLDRASRTLRVQVELNNPGMLSAGMHADVHLSLHTPQPPCVIPSTAVMVRPEGSRVAVVDERDRVHLRSVSLGRDSGQEIEVLSGLSLSDRVVNLPPDGITEGTQVKVP